MTGNFIIWVAGAAVLVAVIVWLLNWLYHRTTKERAFVRTGLGGEKVVINGGALVLPIVHEVTSVHLSLTRLMIGAAKEEALITKDRMRVDVDAEFFLRVSATPEAVSISAVTLSKVTGIPEQLANFFSSEFLGALRSVAAEMSLEDIHENRAGFVEAVRGRAGEAIAKNGLTLDSVAIRKLEQTALEYFNPANCFDAEGLTKLIETVEERRRIRNDIEQSAALSIRQRNLDAEKQTLQLDQESQLERLRQEQAIEVSRAAQQAKIAKEKVEKNTEAEKARIDGTYSTDQHEIAVREEVERARITSERRLNENRVQREQDLRCLEIERARAVELTEIDKAIAVLQKSLEEASERIRTGGQLAQAAQMAETVTTAREVEVARRAAAVEKIIADKEAQAEQVRTTVKTEAERLRNEAENVLTSDARNGRLRAMLIERLEVVIRETVKPLEKIDGIKIVQINSADTAGGGKSPTDEVINSALRYRVQAPLIDELMKDIGVKGANVAQMGDIFRTAKDAQSIAKHAEKSDKDD